MESLRVLFKVALGPSRTSYGFESQLTMAAPLTVEKGICCRFLEPRMGPNCEEIGLGKLTDEQIVYLTSMKMEKCHKHFDQSPLDSEHCHEYTLRVRRFRINEAKYANIGIGFVTTTGTLPAYTRC